MPPPGLDFRRPLKEQIIALCKKTPNTLTLSGQIIDAANFREIVDCLSALPYEDRIKVLKLRGCFRQITKELEFHSIFTSIAYCFDLRELDLSDNLLGNQAKLYVYLKILKDRETGIVFLDLSNNELLLCEPELLINVFNSLPSALTHLVLDNNELGIFGKDQLRKIFKSLPSTLKHLSIANIQLSFFDKDELIELFKSFSSTLEGLSLAQNNFSLSTVQDFIAVFNALRKNITELEISQHNFGDFFRAEIFILVVKLLANRSVKTADEDLNVILKAAQKERLLFTSETITDELFIAALEKTEEHLQLEAQTTPEMEKNFFDMRYYTNLWERILQLLEYYQQANPAYQKLNGKDRGKHLQIELPFFYNYFIRLEKKFLLYDRLIKGEEKLQPLFQECGPQIQLAQLTPHQGFLARRKQKQIFKKLESKTPSSHALIVSICGRMEKPAEAIPITAPPIQKTPARNSGLHAGVEFLPDPIKELEATQTQTCTIF